MAVIAGMVGSKAYTLTYHIHKMRQLLREPAAHDVNYQAESLHTQTIEFLTLRKIVHAVSK